MSDEASVLSAMAIAAFERNPDGSFLPLAPLPAWFMRIVADGTFPFMGHILEEANQFWGRGSPGRQDWGPCTEVDESGTEFHYTVAAVTERDRAYLVFQLDPSSDRMREVLQRERERSLTAGHDFRSDSDAAAGVRQTVSEIRTLVESLQAVSSAKADMQLRRAVAAKCDQLVRGVDELVQAVSTSARQAPPQR
jgi:hypothetical protein